MKNTSRLDRTLSSLTVVLLVATSACMKSQQLTTEQRVRNHVVAGRYDDALLALQGRGSTEHQSPDRVVRWMNEGMLFHLMGEHESSIRALDKAERRSNGLYSNAASDRQAVAATRADTDYTGEDYEAVVLNVVKALGYLGLHDREEALIEARKINDNLEIRNGRRQNPNRYAEDAFGHWLMGMLFELERSHVDARIAFEKAYELYNDQFRGRYDMAIPSWIAEDVVRAALQSGDKALAERYRTTLGNDRLGHSVDALRTHGEVILVHLNGEGPTKRDEVVSCWFRSDSDWSCDHEPGRESLEPAAAEKKGKKVRVTVPIIATTEPIYPAITMSTAGHRASSEVALPINAIATETLRDKLPRVYESTVMQAYARATLGKAAGRESATESGSAGNARTAEGIDKRAWTTLPARIEVARLWLPPGTHDIELSVGANKRVTMHKVLVEAGKRVFLSYRTIP